MMAAPCAGVRRTPLEEASVTTIDTPLLGVALDRAGGHPAAARDSALTQAELVAAESAKSGG